MDQYPKLQKPPFEEISDNVDFGPYREAVNEASRRSRGTLYLLMVVVILVLVSIRNTFSPNHFENRIKTWSRIYDCWTKDFPNSDTCRDAKKDMAKLPFSLPTREYLYLEWYNNKRKSLQEDFLGRKITEQNYNKSIDTLNKSQLEFDNMKVEDLAEKKGNGNQVQRFKDQINTLIRRRGDTYTVGMPQIGIGVDINDLSIFGTSSLFILMLILRVSLSREAENLERAFKKAPDVDSLEILLMSQMFAQPDQYKGIGKWLIFSLLCLPLFAAIMLVWSELATIEIGYMLRNPATINNELVMIIFIFLSLIAVTWLAFNVQIRLNKALTSISARIGSSEERDFLPKDDIDFDNMISEIISFLNQHITCIKIDENELSEFKKIVDNWKNCYNNFKLMNLSPFSRQQKDDYRTIVEKAAKVVVQRIFTSELTKEATISFRQIMKFPNQ